MKINVKKLSAIVMVLVMLIGMFPALTVTSQAANGVETRLNALRNKFPNNYYWNHRVTNSSNDGDSLKARWDESFANSVTTVPCASHNRKCGIGEYDCNFFDGGIQCFGFAGKVFFDVFGQRKSALTKQYGGFNNVRVGDYVRINNDSHSAVVLSRNGNNMTVVECNLDLSGPSYNCKIRWDHTYSINSITYYIRATNYDSVNGISTPTNYFTSLGVSNVGTDDARIEGTINLTYIQSCGFYLGTSTTSMQRVAEATNANTNKVWFDLKSYRGALQSGTTYYYRLFIVINGTEHCSEIKSFKTVSTHQHSYTSSVTTQPTCTKTGVKTYKCSCGNSYTQTIPALGHSFSTNYTIDIPATCTHDGSKSYHCSRCNATTGSVAIPKTEHTYKSSVTKQPTCNDEGIETYTCSCGDSYTAAIPALGHNFSTEYTVDTPATCTQDGSQSYHCTRCDATTGSVTIPMTEHSYGDWIETRPATETQQGVRIRQCTQCGNYETEIIEKLEPTMKAPEKVTGIKAKAASSYVTLSWNEDEAATGYRIYKYNPSSKKYEKVKDVHSTSYKVTGLKAGTSYSFKIRAYNKTEYGTFWGTISDVYKTKTTYTSNKPAQVTGLKMTARTATTVSLKWDEAAGAQIYYIFKYNKKQRKYIEIGSTKGTTFKAKKLLANTDYMFAVQAGRTVGKKEYYGKVSSLLSVKTDTDPAQVTGLKVTAKTSSTVSLKWNKADGAQIYYVFKYNKKAKRYIEIGSTKGTTFKAKKLLAHTDYMFAVQSAKTVNRRERYGKVSSLVSVKTK